MPQNLYIITGAAGHLGSTLVRILAEKGETIRGLLLPDETGLPLGNATYVHGDVRNPDSLRPLFADTGNAHVMVIHCAGIISIAETVTQAMLDVNVQGTENVIALCKEYQVGKLVYVSSVHAIPEGDAWRVIEEAERFSPDWVHGAYAKTKAAATQKVLDAGKAGLPVTVVHPSGILGPYDLSGNHLVQMVTDYIRGKLPAGVKGGYDFVDVRDVAQGCVAAATDSESGQCYILSNRHYTVKEVLGMIRLIAHVRWIPTIPIWLARAAAPLLAWMAKLRHERPLYTAYSLYTLTSNDRFSHDKATQVLGYRPRDLFETLVDTVAWVEATHGSKKKGRVMRAVAE